MIKLNVLVTLPNNTTLPCGEIVTSQPDPRGIIRGAFRYVPEYLDNPLAFPLDPVNLPLISKEFSTQRPTGVHAVFEDALPDDWGRKLLIQKSKIGRGEQTVPKLLEVLGSNGLGALSFVSKQNIPGQNIPGQNIPGQNIPGQNILGQNILGQNILGQNIPDENSSANMVELHALLNAAFRYDSGLQMKEEDLQLLFRAGSSPGGARPKALVRKETGSLWIVKFPSFNDKLDVIPVEAATLELARLSRLTVPKFEIRQIGSRKGLTVSVQFCG